MSGHRDRKLVAAMGSLIVKLHIKDFRIDRSMKNDGEFVGLVAEA